MLVVKDKNGQFIIAQHGKTDLLGMNKADRIEYWQQLGHGAIVEAAFEIINAYCQENGINPKVDRTVGFHSKALSDKR